MSDNSLPTLKDLSASQAQVVEHACTHFEAAWKTWAQGPPRIEAFLEGIDEPTRSVLLAELLRRELAFRSRQGEAPTLAEYRERFPGQEWLTHILGNGSFQAPGSLTDQPTLPPGAPATDPMLENAIATLPPLAGQTASDVIAFVPGYELLGELGRGGMGVVYKARHSALDRVVALKMILSGGHAGEADLARFRTEGEAVARLQHPNIVQIHEVGEHQGLPYFSLEFCSGGALEGKLEGTPLQAMEAASLVEKLARAMHAAHEKGVIHRDLKPANVLLTEDGTPKITDFGLAKKLDQVGQTQTGAVMGTPSYMAPEQAGGKSKEMGPACDVYALGAILYECLTGRPPFRAATVMDTLMQVVSQEPVPPRQLNPKVPLDLETICLKCLQKESGKRYDTAMLLAEDLRHFQELKPITARPVGRIECLQRWGRRNPSLAGSLAAAFLILVLGVVVSTLFAISASRNASQAVDAKEAATSAAQQEKQARLREEGQRRKAETLLKQAEGLVYAGKVSLAQSAFQGGYGALGLRCLDECQWNLRGWEHDYLWSRFKAKQTFSGHEGPVVSVRFSSDGTRLVSASWGGPLILWDAHLGKEIRTFEGHTDRIYCARISPDGSCIVSGSRDKTVRVWDAHTGKELHVLRGHLGDVYSVCFSPDGKRIASGSWVDPIKLWDTESGKEVLSFKGRTGINWSLSFSPDGEQIVSGEDNTLRVWDVRTGKEMLRLEGHQPGVSIGGFSPDGQYIVSGSADTTVKLWDAKTGQMRRTLMGHKDAVSGVCFHPDGQRIVSASRDGTLKVWDIQSGKEVLTCVGLVDGDVDFSPDGRRIVSGYEDGTFRVWDAVMGQEILTLQGHTGGISDVEFSPDSQWILSSSSDGIRLWDATTGKQHGRFEGHEGSVSRVCVSPDGQRIVSVHSDRKAKLWNAQTGQEICTIPGLVTDVCYSPDSKWGAFVIQSLALQVWDVRTGRPIRTLEGHHHSVNAVQFSPDGKRIVAGKGDKTVKVWNAHTGEEILTLSGHDKSVRSVSYSSDGKRIVSVSEDAIYLWDAHTGTKLHTLVGHTAGIGHVSSSPDGKQIVSSGSDNTMKLWDTQTGREIHTLEGHTEAITGVSFSPDGKRIVSASWDKTLKLWNAQTGQETLTLMGHTNIVTCVRFSPDGKRIVSGSSDKTVKVWSAPSTQKNRRLLGHTSGVRSVSFSPDGNRLYAWDFKQRVLCWSTETGLRLDPVDPPEMPEPGPVRSPDGRLLAEPQGVAVGVTETRYPPSSNAWPLPVKAERLQFHLEQAGLAEAKNQWFAVAFYVGRVLLDDPDNAELTRRRDEALKKHFGPEKP